MPEDDAYNRILTAIIKGCVAEGKLFTDELLEEIQRVARANTRQGEGQWWW